ncbi:hypothetical protein [Blastopirellula marina]|uniref:Uncharacterized protein n=1 Tax=Blastopirellula marina TaxID=124 RepID=A0A2S8GCH7_9BACT|nr:hypothetical protein [Blastopirellula marina]PQO42123.1 hypothetical protein C5Y93_27640 [Blastopirellula marina]
MDKRKPLVQFSIRELLTVLVVGTVVIGSLWAHPAMVWVVMLFAMLLVFSMLTIAIIGRDGWRWFGAGFSVFAVGYFATWMTMESFGNQFPDLLRPMPTTDLLRQLQESLTYISFEKDGQPIPAELEPIMNDAGDVYDRHGNRLGGTNRFDPFLAPSVRVVQTPSTDTYHTLGQIFFMLLLGYLGGKFAVGFARFQGRQEEIPGSSG